MNDERFQTLLGRLLDDELSPAEGDELIAWLRENPAAGAEVRKHLQLWELFSQQICAERSSSAFAAACRTRLLAETDERRFVHDTAQRLRRSVEPGIISWIASKISQSRIGAMNRLAAGARTPRPREGRVSQRADEGVRAPVGPWQDRLRQWIPHWLMSPRWALAAAALVFCVLVLPGFLRTQGVPEVASGTETELQISRGGKSVVAEVGLRLQPNDVLRTADGGKAVISYGREASRIELEPNSELKILAWKNGKRFELRQGRTEAMVAHQPAGRPMTWRTPQAEVTVVGTELVLDVATNATRLEVVEGKVQLTTTDHRQSIQLTNSQYAVAAAGIELKAGWFPEARGTILREYWLGVDGNNVGELTRHATYPINPTSREYVSRFAGPAGWSTNYGARFRGYLYPPKTGLYTLWITARESAQLRLSSDESPGHAVLIASLHVSAPPGQWDKYPWQKSYPIKLQTGRKYYIEVLHKADQQGGDHCSVAWRPPGGKREVISGEFLSPFKADATEKKR